MKAGLHVANACAALMFLASAAHAAQPAGSSRPSPAVDVCSLVSAADVEAAARVKVGMVKAKPNPGESEIGRCDYQHADTKAFGTSIVAGITLYKPDKIEGKKRLWSQFMKTTSIPGLGDYAYFNEASGSLFTGHGNKAVLVQVLDSTPSAPAARLEAIKTLAKRALSRL